jgi:hypothetical protein
MIGADQAMDLDRVDDELRRAPALAPDLFGKVIASTTVRFALLAKSGKTARIDRLIEAGAWTDAAWTLRRVIRGDGEWLCSLSRQPNLPMTLDDAAEARHEVLPLAILRAFVEARRRSGAAPQTISAVPRVRPTPDQSICCDNFA